MADKIEKQRSAIKKEGENDLLRIASGHMMIKEDWGSIWEIFLAKIYWLVKFCTNHAYEKGNVENGSGWNGGGGGGEKERRKKQEVRLKEIERMKGEWQRKSLRGKH